MHSGGAPTTPIARRSLGDAVFELLRADILQGELPAGSRLPAERVLCERFGVNRGAVREALKRLQQVRLVAMQQGGRTRVLDHERTAGLEFLPALLVRADGHLDTDVLRGLVEMRTALGVDAARLAAERRSDRVVQRLDQLVADMRAAGDDLEALQVQSLAFWDAVVQGSANVAYRLAFNSLRESYEGFLPVLRPILAEELRDHRGFSLLAQAIRSRDPRMAERRARRLVGRGARSIAAGLTAIERRELDG